MMKKIFLCLFMASSAWAQTEVAPDQYVDLLLLQLQNRFEDSTAQERTNRQYQAYGIAGQYSVFRAEFEFNQFYDSTGNQSLKVEQTLREYDLGLGYRVYQLISDDRRLSLNAFAKVWLGQTRTTVDTTFAGVQTTNESDPEAVYGLGASVMARLTYFIAEAEFRYLNSKNFSPQNVPVFAIKIGASIPY
jgi:hypothetical protein